MFLIFNDYGAGDLSLLFLIQPFPCHERAKQFKEREQLNVTSGSHTCDAKEKDATRHSSLIYCSMGRLPKYLWSCFPTFLYRSF